MAIAAAALVLPLGFSASLHDPAPYWFEYPPLTRTLEMPDFSRPVFAIFLLLFLLALLVLVRPRWFGFDPLAHEEVVAQNAAASFPMRGWCGLALLLAFWVVAWTRIPAVPAFVQQHTFFPLWLGYVLTVDAWTYRRCGDSWLARSPLTFAALFPASAVVWWYFEGVNRSVQNWWYLGVEDYSATHYILMASLAFSTVFPAIFTTREWLMTFPWFRTAYRSGPKWNCTFRRAPAILGAAGIVLFIGIGQFPVQLFFLTWLAPLAIIVAALSWAGVPRPFGDLMRGDYTELFSLAVAALICGFFWELWNMWSLPKWEYSVPYVQTLHLFEMPLPGYGGYLPFGPICWGMWLMWQAAVRGDDHVA